MATLAHPVTARPRSFVPPGNRTVRLSHLDPRPLWAERAPAASPWASPTFWLAGVLVLPVAAGVRLYRTVARLITAPD